MSLWFQSPAAARTSPASTRQFGFGQVPNGISPFSQDDINAPQRTSAAEGVSQNFSSRVSIANNIDNSWNFDGPYFNDNSLTFNTEINNNVTQNYELVNLVSGVTPPAGVTQITAGTNITLSPTSGTGVVQINASLSGGSLNCTDVQNCLTSYWGDGNVTETGLLNGASFSSTGLTFTSRNIAFNQRGMRTNTGTGAGTSVTVTGTETWPTKYTWGRITAASPISPGRWMYTLTEMTATTTVGVSDLSLSDISPSVIINAVNEVELGNTATLQSGYTTSPTNPYDIQNATGYHINQIPTGTRVRLTQYYVLIAGSNPVTYEQRYSFNAQNPVVGTCP